MVDIAMMDVWDGRLLGGVGAEGVAMKSWVSDG
jgi:L-asparaginase II